MNKRVMLFIVEGQTDMVSLEGVFHNLYADRSVEFDVIHGDILQELNEGESVEENVRERVERYMRLYYLSTEDMYGIVHIVDTDGAFIPSDRVMYSQNEKVHYYENRILSSHADQIIKRNKQKRECIKRLVELDSIDGINYGVYYFSRNLEHVLHNRGEHLQNREKCRLAYEFSDRYKDDTEGFLSFISNETIAVNQPYKLSWAFIFSRCNSLKRYTNIQLVFEEFICQEKQEQKAPPQVQ